MLTLGGCAVEEDANEVSESQITEDEAAKELNKEFNIGELVLKDAEPLNAEEAKKLNIKKWNVYVSDNSRDASSRGADLVRGVVAFATGDDGDVRYAVVVREKDSSQLELALLKYNKEGRIKNTAGIEEDEKIGEYETNVLNAEMKGIAAKLKKLANKDPSRLSPKTTDAEFCAESIAFVVIGAALAVWGGWFVATAWKAGSVLFAHIVVEDVVLGGAGAVTGVAISSLPFALHWDSVTQACKAALTSD